MMHAHAFSVGWQSSATQELQLSWSRGPSGTPPSLTEVVRNTTPARGVSGVYIFWMADRSGAGPTWIYVGEARDLGTRIVSHASDPRVQAYRPDDIRVSWAPVASMYRPGVFFYLSQALGPMVAEPLPAARAISVNLPL